MSPSHHPSDATLIAHAAGSLDEACRVVVATHLAVCPECRARIRLGERIGGSLLEALPATPLEADARARCLARLDDPVADVPPPPPPPAGLPASLAGYAIPPWRRLARGVEVATILPASGNRAGLHLMRLAPGRELAAHGHQGLELTAVLRGSIEDDTGHYDAGDFAENDAEAHHAPIAVGEQTCLCLIALGGRLMFESRLLRLLQPFFRF